MKAKGPTKAQLSIKRGGAVRYERDDGSFVMTVAKTEPEKLAGHTWVIWLNGISGCVLLSRCAPDKIIPAATT